MASLPLNSPPLPDPRPSEPQTLEPQTLEPRSGEPPTPSAPRVITAAELLAGARQIVIDHEGSLYRLSLTKNNRLILQK